MNKLPDYYKILSITPDASDEQIKKAFKEKSLQYHPDVNRHEKAQEVFQLINVAYRTLIDSELRRKYDFRMKYDQLLPSETKDIRRRHPSDANYYYRRQQNPGFAAPKKTSKSIRRLNFFIFYSITALLALGIIFGMIDLFLNFRVGGLLFCLIALTLIISGVRIIKKEKRDQGGMQ